ncbi:MAG: UMP kinase [Deltaproteobacteria bacterium]|nr:UMP kinase [Deltaproteobacteria bacterium]
MSDSPPIFKRVLLKLSGEALMGSKSFGIDPSIAADIAAEVDSVHKLGVQVAVMIGGGNIFRGLQSSAYGVGRVAADNMGMLATIINAIAIGEAIRNTGSGTRIMTAIEMAKIAEPYVTERAIDHLLNNRIVIFGGGTGNPFFTTDTAATLRALEINSDVLLKATKVDGVYDADPVSEPSARFFPSLTYEEMLKKKLKVMDMTAVSLAMENNLPIVVFNLMQKGNIIKAVTGEKVGTTITGE